MYSPIAVELILWYSEGSRQLFAVPLARHGNYSNIIRPPTIRSRAILIRTLPNIRIWGVGVLTSEFLISSITE